MKNEAGLNILIIFIAGALTLLLSSWRENKSNKLEQRIEALEMNVIELLKEKRLSNE